MNTLDLVERLTHATEGNRGLDYQVLEALGLMDVAWAAVYCTTNLESAVFLCGRQLPGWGWTISGAWRDNTPWAYLFRPNDETNPVCSGANTPALALCVAMVRAKHGG